MAITRFPTYVYLDDGWEDVIHYYVLRKELREDATYYFSQYTHGEGHYPLEAEKEISEKSYLEKSNLRKTKELNCL